MPNGGILNNVVGGGGSWGFWSNINRQNAHHGFLVIFEVFDQNSFLCVFF